MADYSGRSYARNPTDFNRPTSSRNPNAEYSIIFGAQRPPAADRTQTMSSQPGYAAADRAHTMASHAADMMQRAPPIRPGFAQAHASGGYQIPNGTPAPPASQSYVQHQPQPQYLPDPVYPDRRPYPPQRLDSRSPTATPGGPTRVIPPQQRAYPNNPAANANGFRTQSLAGGVRPPNFAMPGGGYQPAPAQGLRQQAYTNNLARTTAQGRAIPERHDERSMSMTAFARDNEYAQTMSGRVIPNRRRESVEPDSRQMPDARTDSMTSTTSTIAPGISSRHPSQDVSASRAMSMQSTTIAPSDRSYSMTSRPSITAATELPRVHRRRAPLVYPAMLSKVAECFRERMQLAEREKDGLTYKNAFTGSEAVDLIAYIMQTTDRNLALLLGRSLDAQKFFHDVTYDHRLRDSNTEVYQFRETLVEEGNGVNGVFTLTSECYSPTCTPDRLCYSIACPKRVDQQKRLNMRPQAALKREDSRTSLHEEQSDEQKLWINTVPKEIADSVSDKEKKRQEVISEICYTERDFVKDIEYLHDFWLKPLRALNGARPSPIPEHRREKFIRTVFANCTEIYNVNSKLAQALTARQQVHPVVHNVGDIMLEFVPKFTPFITYGASQLNGKYEFEREKQSNPAFQRFTDETERLKESRKLELNGYLTKPTTRLARYPLLLENILKYTADDNPDKQDIPKAIEGIRAVLTQVNIESGKSENRFTLMQLSQQLVFRPGEHVDLQLTEENRKLIMKGILKKSPTDATGDVTTYLFDHAILFVRPKTVNKREELKVFKRPIPLGLLMVLQMEEINPRLGLAKRPSSGLIPGARSNLSTTPRPEQGFPITFKALGKGGYEQTLYCGSQIQREKWLKAIGGQQNTLNSHENIFTKTIINEGFFVGPLKIKCCVPIDGGRKLVVGTENGVYLADRRHKDASIRPKRVLDAKSVTQVDVLEQHSILLVLSDRNLYTYSLDALDPEENLLAPSKRGKKITHANFFKVGVFDGQHLVCCVKTSALSATIKVFKPHDAMPSNKKKSGFARMMSSGQDVLKVFKEFYIPTETYSIHFLRSSLCVGCAKGFEIVTLDDLVTQPLLDQADTSLDFVAMKENLKPIYVERLQRDFLLCYSDFSFFVNKHGWRAFPEWKITWEGNPEAFAIFNQQYILAFEPNFIETRSMDTGMLVHILTGKNIRMLHSSTREILYAYENEMGEDVIASLDFWGRH